MNRLVSSSLLFVLLVSPAVAQKPFQGMRNRIKRDANTLILINAGKMLGSEVADRERWAERRKAAYDAGITAMPPDATEAIIAGRINLGSGEKEWELGMVNLEADRNVTTVAQRYGGSMDEIEGRSAARLPDDHYVVQLAPSMMAAYTPASRQSIARWLRATDVTATGPRLSPYLEKAFAYGAELGTPIIMAMDLDDTISAVEAKYHLDNWEFLKSKNIPTAQLARVIAGVDGIMLGVTTGEEAVGAIRVDCSESPEILSEVGKELLLHVLAEHGAMIDDLQDWKPSIKGNTFFLRGNLSTNGARRVMSVLELPPTLAHAMHDAASPGADQEGKAQLLATQQYWRQLTSLMDDLRQKPKRDHVQTFGQAAIWYDRYARKIDRFPILNVDEQLLDFGATVASSFRNAEGMMKGVGRQTAVRSSQVQVASGGYANTPYGGYRANNGFWGVNFGPTGVTAGVSAMNASRQAEDRARAEIRMEERATGAANVQEIWRQLDEATAAMRRELVNKYSADF